jgi:hypothetical protein
MAYEVNQYREALQVMTRETETNTHKSTLCNSLSVLVTLGITCRYTNNHNDQYALRNKLLTNTAK